MTPRGGVTLFLTCLLLLCFFGGARGSEGAGGGEAVQEKASGDSTAADVSGDENNTQTEGAGAPSDNVVSESVIDTTSDSDSSDSSELEAFPVFDVESWLLDLFETETATGGDAGGDSSRGYNPMEAPEQPTSVYAPTPAPDAEAGGGLSSVTLPAVGPESGEPVSETTPEAVNQQSAATQTPSAEAPDKTEGESSRQNQGLLRTRARTTGLRKGQTREAATGGVAERPGSAFVQMLNTAATIEPLLVFGLTILRVLAEQLELMHRRRLARRLYGSMMRDMDEDDNDDSTFQGEKTSKGQ